MVRRTIDLLLQCLVLTHVLMISHPSLHLLLEILQQFGHFIHFGCGCSQFSFGLPTPGWQREKAEVCDSTDIWLI